MALDASGQKVSQFMRLAFLASPNFVSGSSGWSINQDGSAEFNNIVIRNGQIVSGTALYYSPSPGANNLVASVSTTTFNDIYGNVILEGVGVYTKVGATYLLTLIGGNSITFYSSTAQTAGWSTEYSVSVNSLGNLILIPSGSSTTQIQAGGLSVANGLTVTGGTGTDTLAVAAAQANGQAATITNSVGGGARALLELVTAALGDVILGLEVTGDTNNRVVFDTTAGGLARMRMGSGTASPDVALFRAAANQWAADYLAFNNGGAAEAWLTVGGTGAAFVNGWSDAGAPGAVLEYRRNAAPYQTVSWVGRILAPAGLAANQAITAAVAAAYRPSHTQKVAAVDVTTGAFVRLSFGSTGVLTYQSGSAVGDSIDVGDLVYLDA